MRDEQIRKFGLLADMTSKHIVSDFDIPDLRRRGFVGFAPVELSAEATPARDARST
jgi:hypothetical protein